MKYKSLTGMAPWRDHELATHLSDAGLATGGHDGERSGGAATSVLVSDPAEDGRVRPSATVEELRVALAMMTTHSPAVEVKLQQMVVKENVGVGGGEGGWNGEHARILRLLSRAAVLARQLSGVYSKLATGCEPFAPARGRRRLDKSARGRDDVEPLSAAQRPLWPLFFLAYRRHPQAARCLRPDCWYGSSGSGGGLSSCGDSTTSSISGAFHLSSLVHPGLWPPTASATAATSAAATAVSSSSSSISSSSSFSTSALSSLRAAAAPFFHHFTAGSGLPEFHRPTSFASANIYASHSPNLSLPSLLRRGQTTSTSSSSAATAIAGSGQRELGTSEQQQRRHESSGSIASFVPPSTGALPFLRAEAAQTVHTMACK